MFFRTKKSGTRSYLQIVENRWEDGRPRQRVLATLGRLDQLQQNGQLDALLVSGARFSQSVLLLQAHGPSATTSRSPYATPSGTCRYHDILSLYHVYVISRLFSA